MPEDGETEVVEVVDGRGLVPRQHSLAEHIKELHHIYESIDERYRNSAQIYLYGLGEYEEDHRCTFDVTYIKPVDQAVLSVREARRAVRRQLSDTDDIEKLREALMVLRGEIGAC